jgi:hypothetical protein
MRQQSRRKMEGTIESAIYKTLTSTASLCQSRRGQHGFKQLLLRSHAPAGLLQNIQRGLERLTSLAGCLRIEVIEIR